MLLFSAARARTQPVWVLAALVLVACQEVKTPLTALQCASLQANWASRVEQSTSASCASDSDCLVVGQSGVCGCSHAVAVEGVAVNKVAYLASGASSLLQQFYDGCSPNLMQSCCSCDQRNAACVEGQCVLADVSLCCGCSDAATLDSNQADASISGRGGFN